MERFKTVKLALVMVTVIAFMVLGLLAWVLFPASIHVWALLAITGLLFLYLVSLSFSLLKELTKK